MESQTPNRSHRRGWWLIAGVCAGVLTLGVPAAVAQGDEGDLTPAAPPASSACQGPGCTDNSGPLAAVTQLLLGTGSGCADGGVCFWVQEDFEGDKSRADNVDCCQWFLVPDIDRFRSSKNRYGFRKVQTGNADHQTSCMDPGESRPQLDLSDRFKVGVLGSRCG
jgi:hypothetical protein